MENRPRQSFFSSVFFPFKEDELITRRQELFLVLRLILFFPVPMTLFTLVWALIVNVSISRMVLFAGIVFVATSILFGIQAWFIVEMSNRTIRMKQERNAQKSQQ